MPTLPPFETYRLDRIQSTPYPNKLLELTISLPETQARIVSLVVRSTLGWHGGSPGTRKSSAYFTLRQLREGVGRSTGDAVNQALDALIALGAVEVVGDDGCPRRKPQGTSGPLRLRIARVYVEEPAEPK